MILEEPNKFKFTDNASLIEETSRISEKILDLRTELAEVLFELKRRDVSKTHDRNSRLDQGLHQNRPAAV